MTAVKIDSGICGFSTTVHVSRGEKKKVVVTIESSCEQIKSLGMEIQELDMLELMKNPINKNPIYVKAGRCKLHTSCPVPCGVAKAAEAELGLALKKNVNINFLDET